MRGSAKFGIRIEQKRSAHFRIGYYHAMSGVLAILLVVTGMAASSQVELSPAPSADADNWRLASQSGGIKLYSRIHTGSSLKEFKAVGVIEAPTRAVHNVLNDVENYPKFMPFTAECRIIKRSGESIYAYQRISPKIVGDRDYTICIQEKSWPGDGGTVYSKRWTPANEFGPPETKGVLRVKLTEGSWLLEPEGAGKTRATYSLYTDTGGRLPAFIANAASGIGIRRIFAAVRHQVKDSKYLADKDFLEGSR
ncbi:MAG: polyketide cyclase / dehydrase family protein [Spartobacteria bacterium]|nr:polyketide cyclase / dehydrase family protein [Spartobacteria bacterium]